MINAQLWNQVALLLEPPDLFPSAEIETHDQESPDCEEYDDSLDDIPRG